MDRDGPSLVLKCAWNLADIGPHKSLLFSLPTTPTMAVVGTNFTAAEGWPRVDAAHLAAMIIETALFGLYIGALYRMIGTFRKGSKGSRAMFARAMFWFSVLLFLCITGNWVTELMILWRAFIRSSDTTYSFGPETGQDLPSVVPYFEVNSPLNVANTIFYVLVTLLGNLFMTFRLYIIWSRRWWISVPPLLLCIGIAVSGLMTAVLFSQSTANARIFETARAWITSYFAMGLTCNLYSTCLICYQIFTSNTQLALFKLEKVGSNKVPYVFVQSAAVYSPLLLISLISYALNSNLVYISVAMTNPVIGINFCLILTRISATSSDNTVYVISDMKSNTGAGAVTVNRQATIAISTAVEKHVDGAGQSPDQNMDVTEYGSIDPEEGRAEMPYDSRVTRLLEEGDTNPMRRHSAPQGWTDGPPFRV
ncbi:hypothetical protein DFP72DRAFT_911171 [Ephemerocybe angulata]|uniref:Uncharacterized protein n=1 Tax=Ephemerocybe angulata TaxID=980116 RepID=A0A8H6M023_9AGAR|nr:hypothetical protein DFP72DRAFT_911171 [Tulosesus angulatus]